MEVGASGACGQTVLIPVEEKIQDLGDVTPPHLLEVGKGVTGATLSTRSALQNVLVRT